jgi:hypothetical protein
MMFFISGGPEPWWLTPKLTQMTDIEHWNLRIGRMEGAQDSLTRET